MISIALDLSAEKDFDTLMRKILSEAMDTCHCDAGTVYLLEGDHLHFHTFFTKSKNISSDTLDKSELPPPVPLVRSHVCACSAMDRKKINLPDIYRSEEYDFKGAQKYDALNDYHTGSMLVIPMSDEKDEVTGVLQLINALDSSGNIIPFDEDYEEIIQALASLAAVSINNHKLAQEISDLLQSFVHFDLSDLFHFGIKMSGYLLLKSIDQLSRFLFLLIGDLRKFLHEQRNLTFLTQKGKP